MRPRLGYVLVLGALVCGLAVAAAAAVDSHARIVRLSYVDGQVQMSRDGSSSLETGFLNMPLAQGSQVATGADGFAEIEFENGGTVRLTPSSSLRMTELGSRGDSRVSLVDLDSGTVYFNVKGDSDDDFRVLLQGQEVRVHKSARFRIRLARDSAQVAVMKGELQFTGENQVTVRKDETLTLDFQDRGRYFLAKNIETLLNDAWDRERDQYREQYASNRYGSSRYAYGASDLNYYGSFTNISGYGDCWRPYGYGAAWDPFLDGAWVWYPRWGYVWVSSYPWGWTPYRYGRWIWVSGYNWCWQPGSYWSSWSYYPVVYRWPGWYDRRRCHPPTHHPHHDGSHVVVVGRGPWKGGDGRNGRRIAVEGAPDAPSPRTPVGGGGGSGGGSPGNVDQRRAAITPGLLPDGNAVEELRRVHGSDDFAGNGRGRGLQATSDSGAAGTGGSAVATPGGSSSGAGVRLTPAQPVASPEKMVVAPAPPRQRDSTDRSDRAGGGNGADAQQPRTMPQQQWQPAQPAAPAVEPAQQPVRQTSPPSGGSGSAASSGGSSYRGSSGSSGASSSGSAPRGSSGSSASGTSGGNRSGSSSHSSSRSSGGSRSTSGENPSSSTKSPK